MEWVGGNWFELVQTVGIICSCLLPAYVTHKEEIARKINNLFFSDAAYREIWKEAKQGRVENKEVDLTREPITNEERRVVKMLVLHLNTVRLAMKAGVFVKIVGMQQDVREFFALPIPKAVWKSMREFQHEDFVKFVEST